MDKQTYRGTDTEHLTHKTAVGVGDNNRSIIHSFTSLNNDVLFNPVKIKKTKNKIK